MAGACGEQLISSERPTTGTKNGLMLLRQNEDSTIGTWGMRGDYDLYSMRSCDAHLGRVSLRQSCQFSQRQTKVQIDFSTRQPNCMHEVLISPFIIYLCMGTAPGACASQG